MMAHSLEHTALLVVDLQKAFTGYHGRFGYSREEVAGAIDAVNHLVVWARDNGAAVAYIRHEFDEFLPRLVCKVLYRGRGLAGTPGTALDERVRVVDGPELVKHEADSFSHPKLDAFLRDKGIIEVIVVGLDGNACVHATATGARRRGYRVKVIPEAVLAAMPGAWRRRLAKYPTQGIETPSLTAVLSAA